MSKKNSPTFDRNQQSTQGWPHSQVMTQFLAEFHSQQEQIRQTQRDEAVCYLSISKWACELLVEMELTPAVLEGADLIAAAGFLDQLLKDLLGQEAEA